MSVHTLGTTTANTTGNNITATYNEVVNTFGFTMPADGYVTQMWAYFGASGGGTIFGQLLLFDGSYNLLGGGSPGGQNFSGIGWQTQTIGPYFAANGTSLHLGWYVSQGASQKFYTYGSGGWKGGNVASPSSAGSFGQPGSPYFQAYPNNYLQWIDPLTVSGVSPSNGAAGTSVTVTGGGFVGGTINSVTVGGAGVSFTVVDDAHLTFTVPSGAAGGSQSIQINSDHNNGSIGFYVNEPPTISSLSPTGAGVGQSVTINGSYFDSVTGVSFYNGVAAASYTVVSSTQITAVVPTGATTGPITVSTAYGSATSGAFTVYSLRAYDGTAFQTCIPYVFDGSTWNVCQIYIFDGSAWQQSV